MLSFRMIGLPFDISLHSIPLSIINVLWRQNYSPFIGIEKLNTEDIGTLYYLQITYFTGHIASDFVEKEYFKLCRS